MLNFNVSTAYAFCQLCVPLMREAGGGNILNISSVAARYAQRHFSAYGTAKAALSHLTRLLARTSRRRYGSTPLLLAQP